MPRNHKLSETLFHCIVQTHEFEDALEERESREVRLAVCRPGQVEPYPRAESAAEQEKLVDCQETARNKVVRRRTNVVYSLFKADHLTQAIASHEGLPDWGNDLPVLLTTVRRLRGQLESTTRLLHLQKGVIEGWHRDLDLLLIWKRKIETYEDLRVARKDSADKPTRAKPGGKKWKKAQKRMLSLFKKGELPQTLRQASKLLQSEGFSYSTVRTAAHKSRTLQAHFKMRTDTDDPNGTTRSLLDELTQQTDRRTEQAIRSMSPQQRAKAEAQLREMPASNALELVKTLAHDPDAGRTADVAYIEEADQDHRDVDE